MNDAIVNVVINYLKEYYPDKNFIFSKALHLDRYVWNYSGRYKYIIIRNVKGKIYFSLHNLRKASVLKSQLELLGLEEKTYI